MPGDKLLKIATDGSSRIEVATATLSSDSPAAGRPVGVNASGKVDRTLLDGVSTSIGPNSSGAAALLNTSSNIDAAFLDLRRLSNFALWSPNPVATTITAVGSVITATGTATSRAMATTNMFSSMKRLGYATTAVAGTLAGPREAQPTVWSGNATGLGGFKYTLRFGINQTVAGRRGFFGLANLLAAPTNVEVSTLTNRVGCCILSTSNNLQFYVAGAAAGTPVDLGASFPVNTSAADIYEFEMYQPSNSATFQYRVTRLNTGDTTGWITFSGTSFQNSVFLGNQVWITNNATAAVASLDIFGMSLLSLN